MKAFWSVAAIAAVAAPAAVSAQEEPVKAGVEAWARGDYAGAVEKWRAPAIAGDPDAQFNLGQAYKLGRGVPANLPQAEQWYRKAALQGHPQAEDNYALALFQSDKRAEAVRWLERSAARGEPRTQFVLGTMLFNGDVVAKDWVRAYALLVRASQSGLPQASSALAQMDRYVSLDERSRGLTLARRMEEDAGLAALAALPMGNPAPDGGTPVASLPPAPPPPVEIATLPPPRPAAKPAAGPVTPRTSAPVDGGWRIQLGAFGEPGNAQKLWGQVRGRFADRQPYYVKAGKLTKLLVGPFASRAEANAACAKVNPCIPVAR